MIIMILMSSAMLILTTKLHNKLKKNAKMNIRDIISSEEDPNTTKKCESYSISRVFSKSLTIFMLLTLITFCLAKNYLPSTLPSFEIQFDFKHLDLNFGSSSDSHRNLAGSTGLVTPFLKIDGAYNEGSNLKIRVTNDRKYCVSVNFGRSFVFDISDINNPFLKSQNILGSNIFAISPNNQYVYVSNGRLRKFTLTDGVISSSAVADLTLPTTVRPVAATDSHVWAGTSDGVYCIDANTWTQVGTKIGSGGFNSLIISDDGNTLYAIKTNSGLQIYDVTNKASPTLTKSVTGLTSQGYIEISPDRKKLVIGDPTIIFNIDSSANNPPQLATWSTTTSIGYGFSSDSTMLYTASGANGLKITDLSGNLLGQFYIDADIKDVQPLTGNTIIIGAQDRIVIASVILPTINNTVPPITASSHSNLGSFQNIKRSNSGNILYAGSTSKLRIYNVATTPRNPALIAEIGSIGTVYSVEVSKNDQVLYVGAGSNVRIYDVSTPASPTLLSTTSLSLPCLDLKVTSDNYLYVIEFENAVRIIDVSNPSSPVIKNRITGIYTARILGLSPDEKYISHSRALYSITNKTHPTKIFTPLKNQVIAAWTPDGKYAFTCYAEETIHVYDMTTPTSPILLSKFPTVYCNNLVMSSDGTKLFAADNSGGWKIISVTNPLQLKVLNAYQQPRAYYIEVSKDENTVWTSDSTDGLRSFNVQIDVAINISDIYYVGASIVQSLLFYRKTGNIYQAFPYNYKVAKSGLYSISYNGIITITSFPDWITLNPILGTITVNPNTQSSIGEYNIYVSISQKMSSSVFVGVASLDATGSNDLVNDLIKLGYIDDDFFITDKFNPSTALVLSSTYSANEASFRSKLNEYYFQTLTTITVKNSLNVTLSNTTDYVGITSLSTSAVTVKITLYNNTYFINSELPVLATYSDESRTITLVGAITDVQNCMKVLRINMTESVCDGTINVNDGMNPEFTTFASGISRYFTVQRAPVMVSLPFESNITYATIEKTVSTSFSEHFFDYNTVLNKLSYTFKTFRNGVLLSSNPAFINLDDTRGLLTTNAKTSDADFDATLGKYTANYSIELKVSNAANLYVTYSFNILVENTKPILKIPIQDQINRYNLQTGFAYDIKLDPETFYDVGGTQLTYVLQASNGGAPSSINFKQDLTLEGTAPDSPQSIDLVIIASNGIQTNSDSFTIKYKASASYILNMFFQYLGAAIGVLGFYVYLPMIYNLFFFNFYTHPKKFYLDCEQNVDNTTIPPMCFLGSYNAHADKILTKIRDGYKYKLKSSSDFWLRYIDAETGDFEMSKLRADIDLCTHNTNGTFIQIMCELIKDKIVMKIIHFSKFRVTKALFNGLSLYWFDLFEVAASDTENETLSALQSCEISEDKLSKYIKDKRKSKRVVPVDNADGMISQERNDLSIKDLENAENKSTKKKYAPLDLPGINMPLLKNALLAHVRASQNFDIDVARVEIQCKKIIQNTSMPRLHKILRSNMIDANDGNDQYFGMEIQIVNRTLKFSGSPNFNFAGEKLVVQVISQPKMLNPGGFVLREIIIEGNPLKESAKPQA